MKKIKFILIILNIVFLILIIVKVFNQNVNIEYVLPEDISEENIKYEVRRELIHGEKSLYSKFEDDGTRVNISEELKKEQKLENGLIIKDYKISYKNNFSQITANVYNASNEEKGDFPAYLVLLNDSNQEILRLRVHINKVLPQKETKIITGVTSDIVDVYKCEIQMMEDNNNE